LYLQNVFGTPEIRRKLPNESVSFLQVDREFKQVSSAAACQSQTELPVHHQLLTQRSLQVMRATLERPNALLAATTQGRLALFKRCNAALDAVHKGLEAYLETKRVAFPRFYFISDDELLDILSRSRDPLAVQPHLSKCFDGLRLLEFEGEGRTPDVVAMISAEGERVPLTKSLKARGPVEGAACLEGGLPCVEQDLTSNACRRLADGRGDRDASHAAPTGQGSAQGAPDGGPHRVGHGAPRAAGHRREQRDLVPAGRALPGRRAPAS